MNSSDDHVDLCDGDKTGDNYHDGDDGDDDDGDGDGDGDDDDVDSCNGDDTGDNYHWWCDGMQPVPQPTDLLFNHCQWWAR